MKPQKRWCCNWNHSDKQESRTRCSHAWRGKGSVLAPNQIQQMSGVVPNILYLNDWPFPPSFILFEGRIRDERAGVGQTNQNLFQPTLAVSFSSNLKRAGLVLGHSHPQPPTLTGFHPSADRDGPQRPELGSLPEEHSRPAAPYDTCSAQIPGLERKRLLHGWDSCGRRCLRAGVPHSHCQRAHLSSSAL